MSITFFDVVNAMRTNKSYRFTSGYGAPVGIIKGIVNRSRTGTHWGLEVVDSAGSGMLPELVWEETNTGAVVISEV